ncbi:MAG: tetrathionate reductase family octaheme c-type cytochrome [Desulfovibrionaceae bacterium]
MASAGRGRTVTLVVVCLVALLAAATAFAAVQEDGDVAPGRTMARQAASEPRRMLWNTADHSRFKELQKEFAKPEEVTEACLTCHNEAARQVMGTIHWTWLDPSAEKELGLGKGGHIVNNFCINLQSNEPRCTSCHAGYGWKNKDFDFTDQSKVDCLVCHEQTGTYKKFPTGAGYPAPPPGKKFKGNGKFYPAPDWPKVAQSVGRPTRRNCGTCHFYGGGGDGVKHGDLDSSLMKPSKTLDVHMGEDSKDFECVRCHTTVRHDIAGRIYMTPAYIERTSLLEDDMSAKIQCEACHSSRPHTSGEKMNDHTDIVACQSCHIPEFARVNPTKMWWDWSKAGEMKDGKPYAVAGPYGKNTYDTKKGEFVWAKDVVPEYYWWNGTMVHYTATTRIDPSQEVPLAWPVGERGDERSRIMPFKVHRGMTPYDKIHNTMLIPHLFGKDKDAYWKSFEWKRALAAGQEYTGLPFSGEFGFAETSYAYPTTHMVAPKDNSLACEACHSKQSRLANLAGFYIPGRDAYTVLDVIGWGVVLASLAGILLHAIGRMVARARREG